MIAFKNSNVSNFYICNCKVSTSDALIRFSLGVRNDTLWTPTMKSVVFKNTNSFCAYSHHRFGDLLHLLNDCGHNMNRMTHGHNMIHNRLVDVIVKHRKIREFEISKLS
jgi:hypothetical protein